MRSAFAALLFGLLLAGCATSAEDRAFFNDGWLHPEKGAEKRLQTR